ncbi:DNA topoisomerase III [Desulfofarcimen acetoxidans DSM 771]|uniref:DNA topoisomerase 3 n=1 Tax=Desulfofarcimen acetoxidans (strain ATCC 49208 / DSM 771 / KCTC 5769 / VKM B-1644 / 5575) TaxID=485916 RepID=C8VYF5_DESAS|nr:DNA topoisomerase III [Desulfofarcimen acetoxidans]ACV62836.1 DNA topoisomerase III [Desulfofarcimen acetoxidans DSM 771]
MKSLVLAEKPSVAREIARILNCTIKGKGYLEGNKYIVTWALGHLVTLAEPEDYDEKYKTWRTEDLPMLPAEMKTVVIKKTGPQFHIVSKLMKRPDVRELIIATDAGREGELVARWIMKQARCQKPFKRLWISSLTDEAIREGFTRLRPGTEYNNLYDSAICRAEADWLIGLNVTRALTVKYNAQLSAGRVQTPTLAMLVSREKEIKRFVPTDFWTVKANLGKFQAEWRDKSGKHNRFSDCLQAETIVNKVKEKSGEVIDLITQEKSEQPPLAYDLTELQRDANKKFGYTAQKTLAGLQMLYERHKLVTYPRTDSRYLTSDMVPTLMPRLKAVSGGYFAELVKPLTAKPLPINKRLVDNSKVTDHHAIIPTTERANLAALTAEEKNIYDLIVRRFIAVFYPAYSYKQTTVIVLIAGEHFHASGKVVTNPGWKAVYNNESREKDTGYDDTPEQNLPPLKKGDKVKVLSCKSVKGQTKPPARYTEASLLSAMEHPGKFIEDEILKESVKESGLGTPATRAEIIEKIISSNYVERRGKELIPTAKGIQLVELVPPELKQADLTAKWEQQLHDIAMGKSKRTKFISGIREHAEKIVTTVLNSSSTFKPDNVTGNKCPKCRKFLLSVKTKRGSNLVCPDRSCGHRQVEKETSNRPCPQCKKRRMEIREGKGGKIIVCTHCRYQEKYVLQPKREAKVNIKAYSDSAPLVTNLSILANFKFNGAKEKSD